MVYFTHGRQLLGEQCAAALAEPEAALAAYDEAIAATDAAITSTGGARGEAATLAARRAARQGLAAAKTNLTHALAHDAEPRAAFAELARLQVMNVVAIVQTFSHRGSRYDPTFHQLLWSIAATASAIARSVVVVESGAAN